MRAIVRRNCLKLNQRTDIVTLVADMTDTTEPTGSDWTDREVELVVGAYFEMWKSSLAGLRPVKLHKYRELSDITGRTEKSVERKFQNISAVLERLGLPWIPGLAPLRNFQNALIQAVEVQITGIWNADLTFESDTSGIAEPSILFPEMAPTIEGPLVSRNTEMERVARKFDPALRDLRNRRTGHGGEEMVFRSEIARLSASGRADLAAKVKWVSQEEGDGAGYDIRSYETDGTERFYEVKTTVGHRRTPFFLSRNERDFAEEAPNQFRIFRLYEFGNSPRSFLISPPLDSSLILEPTAYRASFG